MYNDLFVVIESKLDDCDLPNIEIPNFKYIAKNRKKSRHKSGGIGIYVSDTFFPHVKVVDTDYNNSLWLLIDDTVIGFKFLLGIVYIPPESSNYSNINLFDSLEDEIISLSTTPNNRIPVCICGDLNAWSGEINDYVNVDNDSLPNFGLNNDHIRDNLKCIESLDALDIHLTRKSMHKKTNNYGYRLVDLCKNTNLFIANGRFENNATAHFTCNQSSVVDYFIMSPEILTNVYKFEVKDFDPMYSDVHNQIMVTLSKKTTNRLNGGDINRPTTCTIENNGIPNTKITRPKINTNHKSDLCDNIDLNNVNSILADLDSFIDNINIVNSNNINDISHSITNLLINSAKTSGCYTKTNNDKNYNQSTKFKKPWFNTKCFKIRNKYRNAKTNYNKTKSLYNKNKMKLLSSQYKKLLKKCRQNYYADLSTKLRKFKSSNPKQFWKIITNNKQNSNDIKANFADLVNHFKDLNNSDTNDILPDSPTIPDSYLNNDFTEEEVTCAVNKIKRNKSCGIDGIVNEFLIDTSDIIIPMLTKFFNIIINTGITPDDWGIAIITPIFKNKGSPENPDNYRGISILSCISKLFTLIINDRLTSFVDDLGILGENQAGFRPSYSTTDHMFSLKCIIDIYTQFKKKKLYCAFIDYQKAFDTINRNKLWLKLISNGISGKILKIIHNLYSKAKSCVKHSNGNLSKFFPSLSGVRQGDNLSPLLFALYLNDLENDLCQNYKGLSTISEMIEKEIDFDDIVIYLKLVTLLYADDTIIFAESEIDLQTALNTLDNYCKKWDLNVNINKSKIIVFSRGKIRNLPKFTFNNIDLEVVFEYKYLGIIFNYNGNFSKAKKLLYDQGTRAMYALITKARNLNLPIDIQLQLFDTLVVPILLYGCEIWGYENNAILDKLHLKFCKMILNVNRSTPTCMVLGELGRFPLHVFINSRIVNFWSRLVSNSITRTSSILYRLMYSLNEKNKFNSKWISHVKNILDLSGFSYVWYQQIVTNVQSFKYTMIQRLKDQFSQNWLSEIWNSNSCINYRIFKHSHNFENYLTALPRADAITLCKFRTSCTKIPIVTGRYRNVDREDRICTCCNIDIGDEYHYIFICSYFNNDRNSYLNSYYTKGHNTLKMDKLFSSTKISDMKKLASFTKCIINHFK